MEKQCNYMMKLNDQLSCMGIRFLFSISLVITSISLSAEEKSTSDNIQVKAKYELTAQTFQKCMGDILPKAEELCWQKIHWRPSFWAAVVEAQETEKPILLWAMNGHPLGCT